MEDNETLSLEAKKLLEFSFYDVFLYEKEKIIVSKIRIHSPLSVVAIAHPLWGNVRGGLKHEVR